MPTGVSWSTVREVSGTAGARRVVKTTAYDAGLEVEGLEALRAAGAPVPEVYASGKHTVEMELVEGPPAWQALGRALASVHRATSDGFGWHRDNVIGPLRQVNTTGARWGRFFAERRVRVHLDDPAVPDGLARRLHEACDGPLPDLLEEADPLPSLVHGDLWSGNIVAGRAFIDPAVYYADREVELAFMAVFGGIPAAMTDAYREAWPLAEGWRRRRPALQLHHLLVHVRLFGGGYARRVAGVLDELGW